MAEHHKPKKRRPKKHRQSPGLPPPPDRRWPDAYLVTKDPVPAAPDLAMSPSPEGLEEDHP